MNRSLLRNRSLLLASLAAVVVSPTFGEPNETLEETVARVCQPLVDNRTVVGMSVGVIRGDERHVADFGWIAKDLPVTPIGQAIYEVGGITKVFTGVLLAEAVLDGRLDLDQPIAELLPEDVNAPAGPGGEAIHLVHLATHSSGLPRLPTNLPTLWTRFTPPYADYTVERLYDFLDGHELSRAPSTVSEYSNLGGGLLGHLLALNAEKPYGELLAEKITGPLGMGDTVVELSDEQAARLAAPHTEERRAAPNWPSGALVGAGGVHSTAGDLLTFAAACIDPPPSPVGDAIELAMTKHQAVLPRPDGEEDNAMGLAWQLIADGHTHWHNGGTGGYWAMLIVSRSADRAVVVLANTATAEVDRLAFDLFKETRVVRSRSGR
ncbi:MAG: serine hydrolase domain-containing protein [Planctomycetota bacterium]